MTMPSREWLLGWLEGYYWEPKTAIWYRDGLKDKSREDLYKLYLKITVKPDIR